MKLQKKFRESRLGSTRIIKRVELRNNDVKSFSLTDAFQRWSIDQQWSYKCDAMKAIVKGLWIDSATESLEEYQPENPQCFALWIELRVGFGSSVGADDYRLLICTPEWIKRELSNKKMVWGRHRLIILEYDFFAIKEFIEAHIDSYTGKDYLELAQKVARIAAWEFENYQE